jgi:hypothetical protein
MHGADVITGATVRDNAGKSLKTVWIRCPTGGVFPLDLLYLWGSARCCRLICPLIRPDLPSAAVVSGQEANYDLACVSIQPSDRFSRQGSGSGRQVCVVSARRRGFNATSIRLADQICAHLRYLRYQSTYGPPRCRNAGHQSPPPIGLHPQET